jgi:hypothetical protein
MGWSQTIMDSMGVVEKVTGNKGLVQFLYGLDEKSRAILYFLWWHRHAEIAELRDIGDTADDFEVLYRLKEIINKKSQDLWGIPIVSFEQSKIDSITGEKILFSWWYLDAEDAPILNTGDSLVDMFNEKDHVIIIAQVPASVDITSPEMQVKNGILRIKLKKTGSERNQGQVS